MMNSVSFHTGASQASKATAKARFGFMPNAGMMPMNTNYGMPPTNTMGGNNWNYDPSIGPYQVVSLPQPQPQQAFPAQPYNVSGMGMDPFGSPMGGMGFPPQQQAAGVNQFGQPAGGFSAPGMDFNAPMAPGGFDPNMPAPGAAPMPNNDQQMAELMKQFEQGAAQQPQPQQPPAKKMGFFSKALLTIAAIWGGFKVVNMLKGDGKNDENDVTLPTRSQELQTLEGQSVFEITNIDGKPMNVAPKSDGDGWIVLTEKQVKPIEKDDQTEGHDPNHNHGATDEA